MPQRLTSDRLLSELAAFGTTGATVRDLLAKVADTGIGYSALNQRLKALAGRGEVQRAGAARDRGMTRRQGVEPLAVMWATAPPRARQVVNADSRSDAMAHSVAGVCED